MDKGSWLLKLIPLYKELSNVIYGWPLMNRSKYYSGGRTLHPWPQSFVSQSCAPKSRVSEERLSSQVWQYGLWSFQTGDTKLERFLPKNQHTQKKLLSFEFWINGELSKSAKIWLSKSIFCVKNHRNLSEFCFHWKILIKEHICCYWHFLIKLIFRAVYY